MRRFNRLTVVCALLFSLFAAGCAEMLDDMGPVESPVVQPAAAQALEEAEAEEGDPAPPGEADCPQVEVLVRIAIKAVEIGQLLPAVQNVREAAARACR